MGRITVNLLFEKDFTKQPAGILQCDTSGEFLPYVFFNWLDAVHFLIWKQNKSSLQIETAYYDWCETYGYDTDEKFNGNLNEFHTNNDSNCQNDWIIFTSVGVVTSYMDLTTLSAWNFPIDNNKDLDSDQDS
jgi:hypothetical protein